MARNIHIKNWRRRMNNLTLGSLFDGSGGFPLGGLISGITPIWASEIEPFPIMVTKNRLPRVKHYGDISKMNGGEIEPVDIITFGSPCQDLSIAGKRTGLDGERSGLFYEAIRIVKEMREKTNGKYPRYIVWENVQGAFSSHKGEDFRCVLEEICKVKDTGVFIPKCEKWKQAGEIVGDEFSVAWRLLDSQFWGVPQRRKRIYLVADFAGGSAGKILFESEGMPWNIKTCKGKREETSRDIREGTFEAGFDGYNGDLTGDKAATLGVNCGMSTGRNGIVLNDQGGNRMDVTEDVTCTLRAESHHPPVVLENHQADSRVKIKEDNVVQTLASNMGMGGNNVPLVMEEPRCFDVRFTSEGTKNARANSYETDTSRTIDTGGNPPDSNQGGVAVVAIEGNGQRPSHNGNGYKEGDTMYTLNATEKHGVAYDKKVISIDRETFNCGKNFNKNLGINEDGVSPTLKARGPNAVAEPTFSTSKNSHHTEAEEELANTLVASDYKDPPIVNDKPAYGFYPQMKAECVTMSEEKSGCLVNGTNPGFQNGVIEPDYIVRRLTPIECARLQGFPDYWCDNLAIENPTEEDVEYWRQVFDTYNNAIGKKIKPKSDAQIIKWLKDPYSDSSAYKMWGNGVALPCVVFVLSSIAAVHCIE